ncbi:MAG TPA: 30S ribosomal protein S16 [Candidatus Saccharimonadales bacterium]|nr:30S ribosomal protein S16 [Candidatus Saccharimonadales bacterium]
MQRTGRKGHAMFRVVVQDSRFTPTSGRIVANVGSYDPHSKAVAINKDKIVYYLDHGAQPSDRVVKMLTSEGVKLPDWVEKPSKDKKRVIRNVEKLRRNRPEEPVEKSDEKPAETTAEPEEAKTSSAEEPTAPALEASDTEDEATKES